MKADLRRETTAWAALVWAYRDEKAHMATNAEQGGLLGPGLASVDLGDGRGGGLINARLDAHEDAVTMDAMAIEWFGWPGRDRLVKFAARAVRPPAEIAVERLRVLPLYDDRGRMVLVYPERGRREAIACVLDYIGEWPEKAARREREWRDWHVLAVAFLDALGRRRFVRWKIIGRGY
ncbi:MAG: hypothetical protein KGZ65_12800 [Sphingomonadales bacterium]|nr:hypothetical protein [Sphingomonadaceae bacterium]MBS3932106.1 hypothetical protein [Sphingomonadales bacterium]